MGSQNTGGVGVGDEVYKSMPRTGLESFGNLYDACNQSGAGVNRAKLRAWNATVDNLGVLLTLCAEICKAEKSAGTLTSAALVRNVTLFQQCLKFGHFNTPLSTSKIRTLRVALARTQFRGPRWPLACGKPPKQDPYTPYS